MQDQAFLGPESGLAVPDGQGGVDLYVATQWLHVDQRQLCTALGLPPEQVRLTLAGVGGAFGGREDLSMHVHGCMLALRTGKPVKMVYHREESFFGHVHRHPAEMRYEHGADADGRLVFVNCDLYFDGGAYASSTPAVVGNGGTMGIGPYVVPNVRVDAYGVYTNNPPCGAMRGFGSVQTAFAYEAQMDALADELGMDRLEVRRLNAMQEGSVTPHGQVIDSAGPGDRAAATGSRRCRCPPSPRVERDLLAAARRGRELHPRRGRATRRRLRRDLQERGVLRGVRRLLDGPGPARGAERRAGRRGAHRGRRGRAGPGHGRAADLPHRAGGGPGHRAPGEHRGRAPAGSTSASRQTYMTGGAVKLACEAVRDRLLTLAARRRRPLDEVTPGRRATWSRRRGEVLMSVAEALGDEVRRRDPRAPPPADRRSSTRRPARASRTCSTPSPRTAPSSTSTSSSGCSRWSSWPASQDVGRALNPLAALGQIQGGSAQGMGLAVMEEIVVKDGTIRNPSFTDYLIPTILDTPADADRDDRARRPARAVRAARDRRGADDLLRAGGRRPPSGRRPGCR